MQNGDRQAGQVLASFCLGPQDNESLEQVRCERLGRTSHQACQSRNTRHLTVIPALSCPLVLMPPPPLFLKKKKGGELVGVWVGGRWRCVCGWVGEKGGGSSFSLNLRVVHTLSVRSFLNTWPKKKLQSPSLVTTVARAGPVLLVTCQGCFSLIKNERDPRHQGTVAV